MRSSAWRRNVSKCVLQLVRCHKLSCVPRREADAVMAAWNESQRRREQDARQAMQWIDRCMLLMLCFVQCCLIVCRQRDFWVGWMIYWIVECRQRNDKAMAAMAAEHAAEMERLHKEVHARMHACMHVHTRTHACTHACMHARAHVHMHPQPPACTHALTLACMHSHAHAERHKRACTLTHE